MFQDKSKSGLKPESSTRPERPLAVRLMPYVLCLLVSGTLTLFAAEQKIDYHTDIVPLLRDYCSGCHNESDYDGDFSVETFAALMKGGESGDETIIVPGKAAESFLMTTLHKLAKPSMPPKKEPQPEASELALIEQWINQGAIGPKPGDDPSFLSKLIVPHIAPEGKVAKPITAAEFSPDGEILAQARFGGVDLLDARSKKMIRHLPSQAGLGKINAIHFSPDGKMLVTASGISGLRGVATIWAVDSGKIIREIGGEAHRDILFDAEFSPDGKYLATVGYDRTIRLWEKDSGKFVREIPGHNGAVFDIAFSPDSKLLASASADETAKIWRVDTGQRLDTLNQPQGEQFAITFTPDGKHILATGADNRIRMWRLLSVDKPKINPLIHARFAHEAEVTEFSLSRDGHWLATASADRTVKLWRLPMLKQVRAYENQTDLVSALAFPNNRAGEIFIARMDGSAATLSFDKSLTPGKKRTGSGAGPNPVRSVSSTGKIAKIKESEAGELVSAPVEISGSIAKPGEVDYFRFSAKKGETWIIEVNAAQSKSLLDSKVEVLNRDGDPIERVVLQAMRDSWMTFRGRDSDQVDSFRLQNWREMELNEFLYLKGEVVKLWHYPRGPDSGFKVYPGFGKRRTYFGTTGLAHFLGEVCYIVRPLPPGSEPIPNGLPVYRLYYENDDDPQRLLGADSKLTFVAPEDGEYLAKISDLREFGGEKFTYRLMIRQPAPGFSFRLKKSKTKISPGGSKELEFTATRIDGFSGEIEVNLAGLPPGYSASTPVTIQTDQEKAFMVLKTEAGAAAMTPEQLRLISVTATARVAGKQMVKPLDGGIGKIEMGEEAKLLVQLAPDGDSGKVAADGVLEFRLRPGETMKALVKATRKGFEGDIKFGTDDSGRNLPHGVYVDNIGLSGLMIRGNRSEQRLFITAAKWVPGITRLFHLRTTVDGEQVTQAARLVIE